MGTQLAPATTRARVLARRLLARARESGAATRHLTATVAPHSGAGDRLTAHLFDKQRQLERDRSKRKVAVCGRRAGKTTGVAAVLLKRLVNRAGAKGLYLCPTQGQARRILWRELKRLDTHYRLGAEFIESRSEMRLRNGSVLYLAGADKEDRIDAFRGEAFLVVVIDESASFRAHIEELVGAVLEPTLADLDGEIILIGTPGEALVGMFYTAATGGVWALHHWTVIDNPRFPRWAGRRGWRTASERWLANLREDKGYTEDDPTYRREWLAEWTYDPESLVYWGYSPETTEAEALPPGCGWRHVIGLDLGFSDATAWVVLAYSAQAGAAYLVHAEQASGLDVQDIADRSKRLREDWAPVAMVIDTGGLGKTIAVELQRRHGLPFEAAVKTEKRAHIAQMNADLRKGRVRVLPPARAVCAEWSTLQRNDKGEEDDRFANHCADAALYAWRRSLHYCWRPEAAPLERGSREWYAREAATMEQQAVEDCADTAADEADDIWG